MIDILPAMIDDYLQDYTTIYKTHLNLLYSVIFFLKITGFLTYYSLIFCFTLYIYAHSFKRTHIFHYLSVSTLLYSKLTYIYVILYSHYTNIFSCKKLFFTLYVAGSKSRNLCGQRLH